MNKKFWLTGVIIIVLSGLLLQACSKNDGDDNQNANHNVQVNEENVGDQSDQAKEPDIVVAADGTGDFMTVQEAIDSAADDSADPVTIYIKAGTYKEKLWIEKPNIHLIGENKDTTILTFDDYNSKEKPEGGFYNTRDSASTTIRANDFYAENVTFENSAVVEKQAVAVYVKGERVTFYNVNFIGNQDTLFADRGRQYYKDCYIEGTTDFIFGGAAAVFENCTIHSKKASYITAADTFEEQQFGYVFLGGELTGDVEEGSVYLGRPWDSFANVTFINTTMGAHIKPEGWHNWGDEEKEKTARYAEFNSKGPGANPEARVSWSKQLTEDEAEKYTTENVLSGEDGWDPKALIK